MVYKRFHPDLFTTSFNFEAIGVVTSLAEDALRVTGHFRTIGDYVGLRFNSEDFWSHDYVKYRTDKDYTGSVFKFSPTFVNAVDFADTKQQPAAIVRYGDDEQLNYVTLGFFRETETSTDTFTFDGKRTLSNRWIVPKNYAVTWTKIEYEYEYVWDAENEVTIEIVTPVLTNGSGAMGADFDMDFIKGEVYTKESSIPYNATVTITYEYCHGNNYTINFDKLFEGTHTKDIFSLPPTNIHSITFPCIPIGFESGKLECTGVSTPFTVTFNNMVGAGGDLGAIPPQMPANPYRLAEGFDDEYNKNPKRLIESMKLLGYSGMINLYIGASHFYDKWGPAGFINEGHTTMYLDPNAGINTAFSTWLKSYLYHMKRNGFDEFVTSVAMENLQMPEEWKQLMADGNPGKTGWEPPTSFYSVTNLDLRPFVERITRNCLDIVVAAGFAPILQLGESWFWWQEFAPGDVNTEFPGRPPCFYDDATVRRFKNDMGYDLPVYWSSDIEMTEQNTEVAWKLRQYLGEYTEFMSGIAASYPDSQFTILFFPPSVLDVDRVPEFLRICNAPYEYWSRPKLDFIQIEDYDWVTREVDAHEDVFAQAWLDMDYDFTQQHYFSGFVLKHENAWREWPLVERAAQQALGRGYREVFIWAGTQIRRDSWVPTLNVYYSDGAYYREVKMPEESEV